MGRGARGDLRRRGGRLNKRGAGVNRRAEVKLESRLQSSPAEGVTVTEVEVGRWGEAGMEGFRGVRRGCERGAPEVMRQIARYARQTPVHHVHKDAATGRQIARYARQSPVQSGEVREITFCKKESTSDGAWILALNFFGG